MWTWNSVFQVEGMSSGHSCRLLGSWFLSAGRDPGEEEEEEESFQLYKRVVWLVAGRPVYIRNSFILHTVKSAMGLVEGLEDLPC